MKPSLDELEILRHDFTRFDTDSSGYLAPDAVPQPAADAMPFEPAQPDVLSPSQGKGALSRSHRVEQTSYAVRRGDNPSV